MKHTTNEEINELSAQPDEVIWRWVIENKDAVNSVYGDCNNTFISINNYNGDTTSIALSEPIGYNQALVSLFEALDIDFYEF